jgi:hypothetical protein
MHTFKTFTGRVNTLSLVGSHDGTRAPDVTIYFTIHDEEGKEVGTLGKGWPLADALAVLEQVANGV